MFLRSALEQIPGTDPAAIPDVRIDGVSYDSRQVRRGDLFVAIRGQKTDGARFARQAADRGAAAVAAESPVDPGGDAACFTVPDARRFLAEVSRIFYGDPASRMRLAAVTGTNGKTTTAYVTEAILTHAGMRCCLAGTIAMRTVSRQSESRHTTPEAPDLSQFLRQALQEGCTHGALEVSSHSLALQRVFGMKFAVVDRFGGGLLTWGGGAPRQQGAAQRGSNQQSGKASAQHRLASSPSPCRTATPPLTRND